MTLRLGDIAPDFTAETTEGTIRFHDWLGESWGILFSHPADFTPVCTTELGACARIADQFAMRNCRVLAVSVDPLDAHERWIDDIEETQRVAMNFPIVADPDRTVATLYDMIHPNASENYTVRSVFVIGPDRTIKLTLTYPASTGRNFDEILRVLDSLQLTAMHRLATPANWTRGDDCIIVPAVSNEEAATLFPAGFVELKPYLRYTAMPGATRRAARTRAATPKTRAKSGTASAAKVSTAAKAERAAKASGKAEAKADARTTSKATTRRSPKAAAKSGARTGTRAAGQTASRSGTKAASRAGAKSGTATKAKSGTARRAGGRTAKAARR